jgi:hypothetical protein
MVAALSKSFPLPCGAVGFTFRKSFTLPGGFRINLSKSGIGASWGVKGFRVGTGPKGPRVSAYLPGTGIGYTTSLGGGKKAQPSAGAAPAAPGTARPTSAAEPGQAAADAVAAYEARIAGLTALHREASPPLDWAAIAAAPAPPNDPAHQAEASRWAWWTRVAQGIREGDVDAYDAILDHASPLRRIEAIGTVTEAAARSPWLGEVRLRGHVPEVVPAEALSLTKTGKLSTRKLAAGRALALYQDHLCSAAFRVARELFAALPFEVALVHVRSATLDTATGHDAEQTVLSVAVSREELGKLDLARIDPSDALARFPHAMDFSPRTGLAPVEEIRIEDLPGDHAG